jgi:hypothetical protein
MSVAATLKSSHTLSTGAWATPYCVWLLCRLHKRVRVRTPHSMCLGTRRGLCVYVNEPVSVLRCLHVCVTGRARAYAGTVCLGRRLTLRWATVSTALPACSGSRTTQPLGTKLSNWPSSTWEQRRTHTHTHTHIHTYTHRERDSSTHTPTSTAMCTIWCVSVCVCGWVGCLD